MGDGDEVDWTRVRRATFEVRHHYRYAYRWPITNLKQRLVMVPPDRHADQRLVCHELHVKGGGGDYDLIWEQDDFGNRVARVGVPSVARAVEFSVAYRLERDTDRASGTGRGRRTLSNGTPAQSGLARYLEPTALTAPDERLRAVARQLLETGWGVADARAVVERVHDWTARAIRYQVGVTGVQTPAAMALHLGEGVCQDYAHIMLCLLRLLGIPARYVSGHLLGEGVPHAWAEALIEAPEVPGGIDPVAYDPTHHRRAGLQYITVATGRDFADVTPTSGSFTGPALGTMTWGKQARVTEVEYADRGLPSAAQGAPP